MANEDLKGSIFVDGVLLDLCGKRPSLQKAQWVPSIISIPVYSRLLKMLMTANVGNVGNAAYSLLVKNIFLEILTLTQMKVPMKTIA